MKNILRENFLIYRIAQTNTYAAIPYPFLRLIRQCATEYQDLSKVPSDKRVKGIVIKWLNHHGYELSVDGVEQEIPINHLQFETGDFRLTA